MFPLGALVSGLGIEFSRPYRHVKSDLPNSGVSFEVLMAPQIAVLEVSIC